MFTFTLFTVLLGAMSACAAPATQAPGLSTRAGNFPAIPGDNGSCETIGQLCANDIANPANAGRGKLGVSKACALSTICTYSYGDGYSVDTWLSIHYPPPVPKSLTTPRFPLDIYQQLLAPGTTVATQQSYIDAYYSLLATVIPAGGVWPDASYVIATWTKVAAWTGFCSTKDIPYSNLADWFQYSSTVAAPTTC